MAKESTGWDIPWRVQFDVHGMILPTGIIRIFISALPQNDDTTSSREMAAIKIPSFRASRKSSCKRASFNRSCGLWCNLFHFCIFFDPLRASFQSLYNADNPVFVPTPFLILSLPRMHLELFHHYTFYLDLMILRNIKRPRYMWYLW